MIGGRHEGRKSMGTALSHRFEPVGNGFIDERRVNWWQRWRAEAQESHITAPDWGVAQNVRAGRSEYIFCLCESFSLTTIGHRLLGFPSAHPKINCVPVA